MKQVNFRHAGGFPLEQETLERLQTAYRSELYEAIKRHLSIEPGTNYIIAPATENSKGWAVIHQYEVDATGETTLQGILYPITNHPVTEFLRTTRTETNLIYGTGTSQTAYLDYEATYISEEDFNNKTPGDEEDEKVRVYDFYDTKNVGFSKVKDIKAIEEILDSIDSQITTIKTDINTINQTYLPLNGSKAMEGDLSLGTHQLFLNNLNTATSNDYLLAINNQNQVVKNSTLLQSLVDRIVTLEGKQSTAVPIGMIAIWGKPKPFPEGWEEYVPLQGRMPIGLDANDVLFNTLLNYGGNKNKILGINEIPPHTHGFKAYIQSGSNDGSGGEAAGYFQDTTTGSTGGGQSFSLLNPYRVVYFIEYTGRPSDKTPPTSPSNLTASNVFNKSLILNWTTSTDNVGVTNYIVYQNGSLLATLSRNTFSYPVTGLTADTEYSFSVIAKDAAENESAPAILSVKTAVTPTPLARPLSISCDMQGLEKIIITWVPAYNDRPVTFLLNRRIDDVDYGSWPVSDPDSFTAIDYGEGSSYPATHYYKMKVVDEAGNESPYTDEVSVRVEPFGNACFDIESPVTMASGHSKKLKNIVVGDKLQGFSFPNEIDESEGDYMLWEGKLAEASKVEVVVVAKRTSTQPNYYEIRTADSILKVTAEHPLLITEDGENVKWASVKNVSENMLMVDKTGKTKAIESIIFKEEPLEVALLDVEDVDNYIISGIVAHNSKPANPL
ncbi:fibronectin type III domain-containing protein [Flavobacterium procerum]|uniref:Fibronectin type III domain-containing protein n=1 Tax=Flavobacterium procerum TaxID=1455569 RepID=A0ABV6BPM8_9FLAO